jgi:hypothetical protein
MQAATHPETAVYVYCVTPAPSGDGEDRFTSEAIGGGGPVRLVRFEDLAAVVSDSPNMRYTLRREYLDAHQRVLGEALSRSDVLPVSFGSLARNDQQVVELLLRGQRTDLHRYLEYVHDRIEMDVRVFWEQEQLFAEIVAENSAIAELRDQIALEHPDASYFLRLQLGEMTEAAIREKREAEAERLLEQLSPLAADLKVNSPQTEMMVLNAAFLVDRAEREALDRQVQALIDAEEGRLHVQYVGPLAPYNFVTLHVAAGG